MVCNKRKVRCGENNVRRTKTMMTTGSVGERGSEEATRRSTMTYIIQDSIVQLLKKPSVRTDNFGESPGTRSVYHLYRSLLKL